MLLAEINNVPFVTIDEVIDGVVIDVAPDGIFVERRTSDNVAVADIVDCDTCIVGGSLFTDNDDVAIVFVDNVKVVVVVLVVVFDDVADVTGLGSDT
ncbi:hypothetical protein NDU88_004213 [Pleurodeles waltl]|uniref:Uncharacterized protein n=1 Tax=Pleurodeles waltl TaxID=8319 RepID=A0AAV7L0B4_PLEWA|nr:hypothetical protein NDU88_004213 [Pleurodeles waltl]